ncbi:MAG: TIGR02099 family protein, partial [Pseudomonadota bacterium]|nr:TIGR02099 family protein [Pseudomonadota bacterium]
LLEGKNAATQIPALDIVAENFQLLGKNFGRVELIANNTAVASGSEWRINKLSIVNPDVALAATGRFSSRDGNSVSNLSYALDIADAGKLLERFGFANVLRGGKGKMQGDLTWNGLPFALDIPSLTGQIQLDLAAGQFLKVDPGAAKLLGVLSLQSLPRRLTLDFRDVFSDGFAFDGITANAAIARGVARTSNFKMRSVNATVLMDGSVDIADETQNLHVVVLPEINVGAASVVYALAVNPVIGLGSFLAQLFLREPLMRAFTFEYGITGPWQDPLVHKLDRNAGATGKAKPAVSESTAAEPTGMP